MIVVEVGAYDGSLLSIPAAQDENNIVYAIEAIPDLADTIRSHNLPNLNVFDLAISQQVGQSKYYIYQNRPSSSLLKAKSVDQLDPNTEALQEVETIDVRVMGLDEFIEKQAIARIDYLQVNSPGSYLQVIKSAGKYLHSIKNIIVNVQLTSLYEGGATKNEVVSYLVNHGFRLTSCNLHKEGLEARLEFLRVSRYPLNNQHKDVFDVNVPHLGILSTPKDDHVGHLLEQGIFEGIEQAFVWLYLQPGDIFFDCGAHAGLFSAIAAKRLNNQGRIVGFDPNKECIKLYEHNLNTLGCNCFDAFNIGLSNSQGQAELLLGKAGMSAFSTFALGASNHNEIGSESILVEQRSLDEIVDELGIEEVTLAKLDVEGWESFVLEGAKKSIENGKFPLWMIEFTEANAIAASSSTKELRTLIESFGYTLCFFDATNFRLLPELPKPQYPYENLFAVMDVEMANKRLANRDSLIMEKAKDIVSRWDTSSDAFLMQQMYSQQVQRNQELSSNSPSSEESQDNLDLSPQIDALQSQHLSEINNLEEQIQQERQRKEKLQEKIQQQEIIQLDLQKELRAIHLSQINQLEEQIRQERQQKEQLHKTIQRQLQEELQATHQSQVNQLEEQIKQEQQQKEHLQELIEQHLQTIRNTEEEKKQRSQLNYQLEKQIQELKFAHSQLVAELNGHNEQLNSTLQAFQASNQHLQEEVAFLSTNKAAVRKLVKSIFHQLKIFDFIYRNYNFFVPIYNFIFADAWKPSTIFRPSAPIIDSSPSPSSIDGSNPANNSNTVNNSNKSNTNRKQKNNSGSNSESEINLDSPVMEAVVTLRNFASDVDLETVHLFSELVLDIKNVLCINPKNHVKHLLFMLSKAEAKVTCISTSQQHIDLLNCEVQVFNSEISDWMLSTNQLSLLKYDALILDSQTPPETLSSLKGRLSGDTKVIITGQISDSTIIKQGWDSPETIVEELHFYSSPPKTWVYPLASEIKLSNQGKNPIIWPWKASVPSFPDTMPSGKPWPKISIVTVTLNQGDYLEETIRSILLQGYPNLEYIVLDGGSTDNTPEVLDRYRSKLAYCISEPDKGQSNALNKGFNQATGDILAWLNSDDRYLRDTLFKVAIAFDSYDADIVAGGCQLIEGNQPEPFSTHHNLMPLGKSVPLPLERLLDIDGCWQKAEFFYQPEVFWTRQLWEKSGAALDEKLYYSMDYELWVRMAVNQGKIVHIPDPLALYRVHESQKTYGDDIPFLPELKGVSAKYQKLLGK
ncbi:MAG: FkbM family methyltransferase [Cyanobacteria bacterium P01_A01_bin.45]